MKNLTIIATVALLACKPVVNHADPTSPPPAGEDSVMENTANHKDKALSIIGSMETGDTSAIDQVVGDRFVQHDLNIEDGRDGLQKHIEGLPNPGTTVEIHRVFEDGPVVFTHATYDVAGEKQVVFDVFRFEGDVVVEHWNNRQALTGPNPSGRSMVDGPVKVSDIEKTEANKALVTAFFDEVLLQGNPTNLATYVEGDAYLQHNPNIADGMSSLFGFIQHLASQGTPVVFKEIHQVLGQGGFVLVMSEATFGEAPTAFYDEHWDILESIAPRADRRNDNGKF